MGADRSGDAERSKPLNTIVLINADANILSGQDNPEETLAALAQRFRRKVCRRRFG